VPTNGHEKDGEDSVMQSSPFGSSMPQPEDTVQEQSSVLTLTLVPEEDLASKALSVGKVHRY
jgi:hypothetical protein